MSEYRSMDIQCVEKTRSYMLALEEERRKIEVFQRELPLCMDLVSQAIESCKQRLLEITTATSMDGQITSECSEQNSMKGFVLEEFIPMKKASSSFDDYTDHEDEEEEQHSQLNGGDGDDDKKKSDWLKSVQLWNPNPEPAILHEDSPSESGSILEHKTNNDGLQLFQSREKAVANKIGRSSDGTASRLPPPSAASTSSTAEVGGGDAGKREERQKPSGQRKQRRCWSMDLHRRFVHALHQLGGPQVATPKQIRELMQVDGLTNDEVKSHLQKYRLHAKGSPGQSNGQAQQPQFVIWVPTTQTQYAAATTLAMAHKVYAPVAAALPSEAINMQYIRPSNNKQKSRGSRYDEVDARRSSNSTTTSSSAHTVTVC